MVCEKGQDKVDEDRTNTVVTKYIAETRKGDGESKITVMFLSTNTVSIQGQLDLPITIKSGNPECATPTHEIKPSTYVAVPILLFETSASISTIIILSPLPFFMNTGTVPPSAVNSALTLVGVGRRATPVRKDPVA